MSNNTMGHTPTPWAHMGDGFPSVGNRETISIYQENGQEIIADLRLQDPKKNYANAAFIVQAVNAHQHLISALQCAYQQLLDEGEPTAETEANRLVTMKIIKETLSKAGL